MLGSLRVVVLTVYEMSEFEFPSSRMPLFGDKAG